MGNSRDRPPPKARARGTHGSFSRPQSPLGMRLDKVRLGKFQGTTDAGARTNDIAGQLTEVWRTAWTGERAAVVHLRVKFARTSTPCTVIAAGGLCFFS